MEKEQNGQVYFPDAPEGAFYNGRQVYLMDGAPCTLEINGNYKKIGFKWHYFMVYFVLWLSALAGITEIIQIFGKQGTYTLLKDTYPTYATVFAAVVIIFDVILAATDITCAVLLLRRRWLGEHFLVAAYLFGGITAIITGIVGLWVINDIIKATMMELQGETASVISSLRAVLNQYFAGIKNSLLSEMLWSAFTSVVMILVNYKYYHNRRWYFK